jgi:Biotin-requiring enzyme
MADLTPPGPAERAAAGEDALAPASSRTGDGARRGPIPSDEPDPHALRIDVRASMGLDAGPWTVRPDGPGSPAVRGLDATRGVSEGLSAGTGDFERLPVVLGPDHRPSRKGIRRREVVVGGWRFLLDVEPERLASLRERARRGRDDAAHAGPLEVRAIIPGRVVAVSVAEGDAVVAGQQLLVIEAMKMQNELRSPRAGIVDRIAVGVGQTVDLAALLLVLR